MQKAELVLTKLNQKSKEDKTFQFRRLYRNLFNMDFYLNAYGKIYCKDGNMTMGVDGKTIDGYGFHTFNRIIENLKTEKYKPYPVRRKYIPKKNSQKLRPLGIPSIDDKLVQEIVRQILEAIYEPDFSNHSHGFRPNRSCQTALYQIKRKGAGTSWVVEGDIKGFFDNIDHDTLIEILRKRIDDNRFLLLIKKFLKAGIMEEGKIKDSITGAPQGGIVSPILANIYLNELDIYMEKMSIDNHIGMERTLFPEYSRLIGKRKNRLKRGLYEEANQLLKQAQKLPAKDPMDPNFRRVYYVRYADDFVILVKGSKELAFQMKEKTARYLKEQLKLELNQNKTLVTNILKNKVQFLGYEFQKSKCNSKMIRHTTGRLCRSINGAIQLLVPANVIKEKIKPFIKNGKPCRRNERINNDPLQIIQQYNAEIRGLFKYYQLASNVSKRIAKFQYYHYYSMVRTLACKYKISVKKTFRKFGVSIARKDKPGTRNIIGIRYKTKSGLKTLTYFSDSLSYSKIPNSNNLNLNPNPIFEYKNELIGRILNRKCELCGTEQEMMNIETHHIRGLNSLRNKYQNRKKVPEWVKRMLKLRRKTLVVCKECHNKIHY